MATKQSAQTQARSTGKTRGTSNTRQARSTNGSKNGARSQSKKGPRLTAKNADKHDLYQRSVQDPSVEVFFMDRVFRSVRKRRPLSMREDFCGTAYLCAEWAKSLPERTAVGVDIDPSVLAWGKEHNLAPINEPGNRVRLLQQDVRAPSPGKFDIVNAFNFSYWIFRTRDEMRDYFKKVRRSLNKEGIFICDAYGGWEAQEPMFEERKVRGGFTYVWDQDVLNPIDHTAKNHIHFKFRDGSELKNAFSYEWRFWSLPELQELLQEAGFSNVQVYWDQSEDEDREDYKPSKRAENQPGWLAYLVSRV